jgi:hypothetical protein
VVICYGSCITPRGEKEINFRFEISDLRLSKSAIYNLKSTIKDREAKNGEDH